MAGDRPLGLAWLHRIATALVLASLLLVPLATPFTFTNDGPEHVLAGMVANHPERVGGEEQFILFETHTPRSANGFIVLFRPLEIVLGWQIAHQVVIAILLLANAAALLALRRALSPGSSYIDPVLAATPLCWTFWMGFLNYHGGLACGLATLAWAASVPVWNARRVALLGILLLVTAWLHMLPALGVGFALGVLVIARSPIRQLPRNLAVLLIASAPVLVLQILVSTSTSLGNAAASIAADPVWPTWLERGRMTLGGPSWRWAPPVVAALAVLALTLVRRHDPTRWALALVALAGVVAAGVLPRDLGAWQLVAPRFGMVRLSLALALAPACSARRLQGVLLALGLAWGGAASLWGVRLQRDAFAGCEPFWEFVQSGAKHRGMSWVIADRDCDDSYADDLPFASFTWHLGALVATAHGGLHWGFHGMPGIHTFSMEPIRRLDLPPPRDGSYAERTQALRATLARDPASVEAQVEHVFMAQRVAEYSRLVYFGDFAPWDEVRRYGVAVAPFNEQVIDARFTGSTAPVVVRVEEPAELLLELGWMPVANPVWRIRRTLEPGEHVFAVPLIPPTDVWLRASRFGTSEAPLRCETPDPLGRVIGTTSIQAPIVCRVVAGTGPAP